MNSLARIIHIGITAACIAVVANSASAFPSWDAGAANDNFNTAANWNDQGFEFVPGPESLAVHDNLGNTTVLPAIIINANAGASAVDQSTFETVQGVDSLRLSHGGSVIQSAGTLNVTRAFSIDFFTQAVDNGLWIGESGTRTFSGASTNPSVYTLSGGVIDVKDTADSIQIGRAWNAATNSDYSDGRFVMSGGTVNSAGDATIGLDGHAEWTQTGGVYNGGNTFIGRFASPNSVVNLSGNTDWNLTGSLLVADQQTQVAFRIGRPEGAGVSQLNITGSQVGLDVSNGLFLRGNATLNYVADAVGVSPIVVNGTTFELSDLNVPGNRPNLSVNLSAIPSTNSNITLINANSIAFGQFQGLPEGSTSPSFGNRTLTYRGGADGFDVMLVNTATYVPPTPIPSPPDAVIGRWSMDNVQSQTPGAPFEGNPSVLDRATGTNQGILPGNQGVNGNVANNVDHLWFFSADLSQDYQTSTQVPPVSMFANGNNGGTTSYNAAAVLDSFTEGALFFPQDIYGNEFSFDGSFSVEAFIQTSDGTSPQQIIVQGEGFNRYGVSMNDTPGAIRLSVNDGEREEIC